MEGIKDKGPSHEDKKRPSYSSQKPRTNKSKKVKTKHMNPKILELRRTIQLSCSNDDFQTAIEAYELLHLKEGFRMEAQSYYNLLNLCDGFSERGVHIGTPKEPKNSSETKSNIVQIDAKDKVPKKLYSLQDRTKYAFEIKAAMDAKNLPLNETAYTALVRILCRSGDLSEAENMIRQADGCAQCKPKLRMYSCLISAFCDRGDLGGALRVWARMASIKRKNKTGTEEIIIEPTEREYCDIMKCCVKVGDVKVMERTLSDLAEDVLVPSLGTTNTIIQWFQSRHAICRNSDEEPTSALEKVQGFPSTEAPSLEPLQYGINCDKQDSSSEWEISKSVPIDLKTGTLKNGCLEGRNLKPVALSPDAWKAMLAMNENIVIKGEIKEHAKISQFAGGGKGKKRILTKEDMEKRSNKWGAFIHFLTSEFGPSWFEQKDGGKRGKKLDMVIDGANIGYYKQNFARAPRHVDYNQIDRVVQLLRHEGKNVLLFLHERHFAKKMMPHWAEKIVDGWERDKILYRTPHGCNDDWFWMHAALWCGRGTMVLSNDLMRDHHFQMLAHRSFLRWQERHQVRFDIEGGRKVLLEYPDVYSRRIQKLDDKSLVIPLPKQGDENRFLDGCHEADESVPQEETYVCINLKV
jgi:ribonuclease P protein 3